MYFLLSVVVDLHAPIFWSIISDTIDYGQVKSATRVLGFSYGGISVGQKGRHGYSRFCGDIKDERMGNFFTLAVSPYGYYFAIITGDKYAV